MEVLNINVCTYPMGLIMQQWGADGQELGVCFRDMTSSQPWDTLTSASLWSRVKHNLNSDPNAFDHIYVDTVLCEYQVTHVCV